MQKLKAILADDEESAREVLANLLARFCPEVELLASCANVPEAVAAIETFRPDLVFLDIEMPEYAGYELVNFVENIEFEIVFITAYDQYAIRAFELAAIDYLLKPIDINRLQEAVARAAQHQDHKLQAQRLQFLSNSLETKQIRYLLFHEKGQQLAIPFEHIIAIEAQESYCTIHTTERRLLASKNLRYYETLLEPVPDFLRVHKSWIINRAHLKHYSRTDLTIQLGGGVVARLSKYKKAEFEAAMLG